MFPRFCRPGGGLMSSELLTLFIEFIWGQQEDRGEKSWSRGSYNWTSKNGPEEEAQGKQEWSVGPSHDTLPLPLFSHFVFRSPILFFFIPTHTHLWKCLSVRSHAQLVGGADASVWGLSYRFFNVCWQGEVFKRSHVCIKESAAPRHKQQRALECRVSQFLRMSQIWICVA